MNLKQASLIVCSGILAFSCIEDDIPQNEVINAPATYVFERDGASTVNYQGQTDRLNMLSEVKSYLVTGDQGQALSLQKLLDMYSNTNSPFSSQELNQATTKQLENKTNAAQVDFFKGLMANAAEVSEDVAANSTAAGEGIAGRIERGNTGNFVNVNEKGWEFTQLIEKGLMGAVFYDQIFNSYLTDAKIGDAVDNDNLVEGKNYTTMEHHWDEAFGYWGVPTDFPKGDPVLTPEYKRFWANYTNGRDGLLNVNQPLMDAYILGRAAIVANDHTVKKEQVEVIIDLHELVSAATAVHYINDAMDYLSSGDQGNLFHSLSEAYTFVSALQFSPRKKITQSDITEILTSDFGTDGDFWKISNESLQNAKNKLTTAYPELNDHADVL
ncbi:DUF4856 domain-containing protein [Algoriphagus yeomjeoni]|uniref:Uncharacterized protein DUF4856 n=1 Tax=Algoriphagus yeomjeoni TaxID=291403 RepID=A0A327P755_9BACT|nr:DUF4856 domain-containing protein [Algoriphagus yeomjeoni]RAI86752.1 uncharacterized protein DUF4856 [Algoriphagus yeomjeoni]